MKAQTPSSGSHKPSLWHRLKAHPVLLALLVLMLVSPALLLFAPSETSALEKVLQQYSNVPTYSVILKDTRYDSGLFSESCQQKFTVMVDDTYKELDWLDSTMGNCSAHEIDNGMTIYSQTDFQGALETSPAGYDRVGDSRYGSWQEQNGQSMWVWYGKYRLLADALSWSSVSRTNHADYKKLRAQGSSYYSPELAKNKFPGMHAQVLKDQATRKAGFSSKVAGRIGRSSNSMRSRSSGKGK